MRLLMFGPQGVGKGTQAGLLAAQFGIPHISTGDIFRANIAGKTELGQQVSILVDAGELVPDSLTQLMLADRLREPDTENGLILDGFPRTSDQAEWLDAMLTGDRALDAVVVLDAPHEVLLERSLARGRSD